MPGATEARRNRRVLIRYEYGTRGPIEAVIGRLLINSDTASVYVRRGLVELRGEWPDADDQAIPLDRIVKVQFVNPNFDIGTLVAAYGLKPSEEPPY